MSDNRELDTHAKLRAQIRAGRELLSMNQSVLAERLGMTLSKISRAETGDTKSGDVLLEIKSGMERLGIVFTKNGVEWSDSQVEILTGQGCYLRLLDEIAGDLRNRDDKELLIMFASDGASPPEVNERYRLMRKSGITMRQLISEDDSHIMGPLGEYRTIPANHFINIVTVIYGSSVAQVSGDESRIVIHHDEPLAKREREIFSYFWETGKKPHATTADENFEE